MPKIFFHLLLVICLVIIQISFLPTLDYPTANLTPILSVIIFITIILSYHSGLWLALVTGLFLELYSVFGFGMITFSLIMTVVFINHLFDHFFTNRSLLSLLILGLSGILCYNLILIILAYFLEFIQLNDSIIVLDIIYLYNLCWQIILNLILLASIFLIVKFVGKQLKPYFIIK